MPQKKRRKKIIIESIAKPYTHATRIQNEAKYKHPRNKRDMFDLRNLNDKLMKLNEDAKKER